MHFLSSIQIHFLKGKQIARFNNEIGNGAKKYDWFLASKVFFNILDVVNYIRLCMYFLTMHFWRKNMFTSYRFDQQKRRVAK